MGPEVFFFSKRSFSLATVSLKVWTHFCGPNSQPMEGPMVGTINLGLVCGSPNTDHDSFISLNSDHQILFACIYFHQSHGTNWRKVSTHRIRCNFYIIALVLEWYNFNSIILFWRDSYPNFNYNNTSKNLRLVFFFSSWE